MPQTREHLAILDLLRIPKLVLVLTKCDLVEDPAWIDLVEADVRALLAGTSFAAAGSVRVSAATGIGLDDLKAELAKVLAEAPARVDRGRPRLPIDRAFTMTGFGTVVTGTLLDGKLTEGDDVMVMPGALRGRVRGLQTHRRKVEVAFPGSRVAVNVTGIEVQQVQRGDVLCAPGAYRGTRRIDARVEVLGDAAVGLRHDQSLKLHLGSADVLARVRLLMTDEIKPGGDGWVQLVLESPVAVADGDRFVLRRPAPPATIGGGTVVDGRPQRRHRRRDAAVVRLLERKLGGSPEDRIGQELFSAGPLTVAELARKLEEPAEVLSRRVETLVSEGAVRAIGEGPARIYIHPDWLSGVAESAREVLLVYHRDHPQRSGMPREDFRRKLGLETRGSEAAFGALEADGVIVVGGPRLRLAGFSPTLSREQHEAAEALAQRFAASPFSPPSIREATDAIGLEAWTLLVEQGTYVPVAEDVAFAAPVYARLVEEVAASLEAGESVTVATVRDRYGTSRKYALGFLEHLDRIGISVRVGDERRRGPTALAAR